MTAEVIVVAGAIPPYLPESDAQNHAVMDVVAGAAAGYARGGFTTVVDGILGPWMVPHLDTSVPTHYVVLRPSRDVALARAQARTGPDDLVDADPVLSMWDQLADLGDLESHALDTTDEDSDVTLARVVEAIDTGRLRIDR